MKPRGDLVVLIAGVVVTVVLALLQPQPEAPSTYSSYDTGRNGYRAVYEVLRREGLAPRRFERELGTLHGFTGTFVVSANTFDKILIAPSDIQRLQLLVSAGARLIVLGVPAATTSVKPLAFPGVHPIAQASLAHAAAAPLTGNVRNVAGTFIDAFDKRHGLRPLLTAGGKPVAISYALGRGTVIAVSAPNVLSNAMLARSENAWFAWDLLSGHGPVFFDERLHGYAVGNSVWSVMPSGAHDAVWIVALIVLLAVIAGAFRSAPPVELEPNRPRDSSAYLTAMAVLLRRARAGAAAIDRFADDASRLARMKPSLAARSDIAAELGELRSLSVVPQPSKEQLLDAARCYVTLRKDLAQ
jgi:hypothetical protein